MAIRQNASQATSSTAETVNAASPTPRSSDIDDVLAKVDALLQADNPSKALDLIARTRSHSPWLTNAIGVCQLRLGKAEVAADMYRGLVLKAGGVVMREDVPTVFKTNYAVALLQGGNVGGCLRILAEVRDGHPVGIRLKTAIQQWKKRLSIWEKVNWYMGGEPCRKVELDFPPGDLM